MKRILSVMLALVMAVALFSAVAIFASAAETTATITFDDTAKRTVGTTSQQVWVENGVTFTNDKASSTSDVNTSYYNPVRLYKGSSVTIAYNGGNISKIEVTCNSASYATELVASVGAEAAASDKVVTITPTDAASSYTIASMTAQVRVNSITVYAVVEVAPEENTKVSLYNGGISVKNYESLEAALVEYDCANGYLVLMDNAALTEEVELPSDLYIDLNGHSLTGTINPDGYAVYGMDSTTNEYNGDSVGYMNVTFSDGSDCIADHWSTQKAMTDSETRYMAITDENGTSFHRFDLDITHASVNTVVDGVGYKAVFAGDDQVKAQLASFSYTLQLGNYNPVVRSKAASSLVSGDAITLRINNYDIAGFGETALKSYVTLTLNDNSTIVSDEVNMSMRDMMNAANANYTAFSETQLTALGEMIGRSETLQSWWLYNIGGLAYMTQQDMVDCAEAMTSGAAMGVAVEMTGTITEIGSVYSEDYGNITVDIQVDGVDVALKCYRMTGDGINIIRVGDEITVSGNLSNYSGSAQFAAGCTMTAYTSNYVAPETAAELVDDAYTLTAGTQLPGTHTLTGVITSVDTVYNATYANVTVTIAVEGREDKTIQCFRMTGTGADVIAVGDTITVTGTIKNYLGTIEFDSGCTLDSYVQAPTAAEIVANAYALEDGASMSECYYLTGVIASVDTAYDETAGVVDLTITCEGQTIKCVGLSGNGADLVQVGDTVTVLGKLSNAAGVIGFNGGCFLDNYVLAGVETRTYTFADYTAGEQYAENEEHVLDDVVTVTTTQAHFTTQLRLYSSSTHDGYAIIKSTKVIKSILLNAGNKVDTVNVYGSTDGTTWTLVEGVSVTQTSYNDYTVSMPADAQYNYIKLDVAGNQQVRIAYMTLTLGAEVATAEEEATA